MDSSSIVDNQTLSMFRRPNWSSCEVSQLQNAVQNYQQAISGKMSPDGAMNRNLAWINIAAEINGVGHQNRTPYECRRKWAHYKSLNKRSPCSNLTVRSPSWNIRRLKSVNTSSNAVFAKYRFLQTQANNTTSSSKSQGSHDNDCIMLKVEREDLQQGLTEPSDISSLPSLLEAPSMEAICGDTLTVSTVNLNHETDMNASIDQTLPVSTALSQTRLPVDSDIASHSEQHFFPDHDDHSSFTPRLIETRSSGARSSTVTIVSSGENGDASMKTSFESLKQEVDMSRLFLESEQIQLERERVSLARERVTLDRERLQLHRLKLAAERENFVSNATPTDDACRTKTTGDLLDSNIEMVHNVELDTNV